MQDTILKRQRSFKTQNQLQKLMVELEMLETRQYPRRVEKNGHKPRRDNNRPGNPSSGSNTAVLRNSSAIEPTEFEWYPFDFQIRNPEVHTGSVHTGFIAATTIAAVAAHLLPQRERPSQQKAPHSTMAGPYSG